jgi:hypothetical protein
MEDKINELDTDVLHLLFDALGITYQSTTTIAKENDHTMINLYTYQDKVQLVIDRKHQVTLDKYYLTAIST